MKLLLDTHAFLWLVGDDPALSSPARSIIADARNDVLLSIASCWELAVKHASGKLVVRPSYGEFLSGALAAYEIGLLPISLDHLAIVSSLPPHHRDPFDRLIVAQSLAEGVPLLSRDVALNAYGLSRFW